MAKWLVSQGDRQFSAQDLSELKRLASSGQIGPGDMIQPPGAADWLYASEVPELQGLLQAGTSSSYDDEVDYKPARSKAPLALVFVALIGVGGWFMYENFQKIPDPSELELLGENGLAMNEMLVTEAGAPLHKEPAGKTVGTLEKDITVVLLGKRGPWYHIKAPQGADGYVKADHVVPAYFFADARERENHDPVYNPDRYVFVKNSSWLQVDEQNRNMTIFQFMLQNKSKFEMTGLVLAATIKDKNGRELEVVEIPIEGSIPPMRSVMVGTLDPERKNRDEEGRRMTTDLFDELVEEDEDLQLRWSSGVEVEMQEKGFTEANIDILELRAQAPRKKKG